MKSLRLVTVLVVLGGMTSSGFSQNFAPLNEGLNRNIYHFLEDVDDHVLYVSGDFTKEIAGGVDLNGVGRWDGTQWSPTVFSDPSCQGSTACGSRTAIAKYGQDLISAITYNDQTGARQYALLTSTGNGLDTLGHFDGPIHELKVIDNELYALGWFTSINDDPIRHVGKFSNGVWQSLSFPVLNNPGYVADLVSFQGNLVAAGNFDEPGLSEIAMYDGTAWLPVGDGLLGDAAVNHLEVYLGEVYAAGMFTQADGNAGDFIQKWNGQAWTEVAGGLYGDQGTGFVRALHVHDNYLFVGGTFTQAGDVAASYLSRWDGQRWCALGELTNPVIGLGSYDGDLMISSLGEADGVPINFVVAYTGGDQTTNCGTAVQVKEAEMEWGFSLFPNPTTNGTITIQTTNHPWTAPTLRVIDLLGQTVYQQPINLTNQRVDLDLSHLAAGTYRVTLTGAGFATATLVIAK